MAPRQVAQLGKRSWRESSNPRNAPPFQGSRTPLRVLMGLIVAGLLAWLGWLLMRPAKLETLSHFVALTTGKSDLLSTPPILFERATLEPLKRFHHPERTLNYVGGSNAEGLGDIEAIKALLAGLPVKEPTRLIVYVSAHGISDDGDAYILGPDFDVLRPEEGRYSATELIDIVAAMKCEAKLLVFDCSRLAVLPRIGMAFNEFASIVENKARQVGDDNLWVLTAASELETSPLGLATGRSAFGGALVDALTGRADQSTQGGDEDRDVTLAELEALVQLQCSKAPVATPAPRLSYCGRDATGRDAWDRVILRIPVIEPSKEATDVKKPATPLPPTKAVAPAKLQIPGGPPATAAGAAKAVVEAAAKAPVEATEKEAVAAATAPVEAPEAKEGESSPPAPAPATTSSASEKPEPPPTAAKAEVKPPAPPVDPAILRAWRLRDQLQRGAADAEKPSPVDYAPQIWNELNATLVALHLKQMGQAQLESGADAQIDKLQQGLERLAGGVAGARDAGLLTDRLLVAAGGYETSAQKRHLDSLPREYAQAQLDLRRYLFQANQYVEWHATAHCAAGDVGEAAAEAAQKIEQLLDELSEMDRQLATLEKTRLATWRQASGLISQIGKVRDKVAELERSVASEIASIERDDDPVMQRRLESLLATCLATGEQRKTLLAALKRAGDGKPRSQSQPRWSAAIDHLRLEIKLVQLVDPSRAEDFDSLLEGPLEDNTVGREKLREAGRQIGKFYAQLPGRTQAAQAPGATLDEQRTAEKMFAVMHPRDAAEAAGARAAHAFVTSRLRAPAEVVLQPPAPTTLSDDDWATLSWRLQRRNIAGRATAVVDRFDEQAFDVRLKGTEQPVKPGDALAFSAGPETIELEVKARRAAEGPIDSRTRNIQLTVNITDDAGVVHRPSGSAQLTLPGPNRIDLTATCVTPHLEQSNLYGRGLRLQTFPHRATTFAFKMANHSDNQKNLKVRLFAVPAPDVRAIDQAEAGFPPGRVFVARGQLPPRLAAWAAAGLTSAVPIAEGEINLPAGGEPRPLILKAPGGGEEKKLEEPKPADPAAPEAAPAPKPAVDVTHGLLCQIVDATQPDAEPQLRWIEIEPHGPRNYVEVESRYDSTNNEIRFDLRALDINGDGDGDLPPGIAEQPIAIELTGDGGVPPVGRVIEGKIASADVVVPMIRKIEGTVRGIHDFELKIDGFPRADVWRVHFDNGKTERLRDRRFLEIDQVGMLPNEAIPARLYRMSAHAIAAQVDPKQWPAVVDDGEVCAFNVSGRARDIVLKLRVDAPLDQLNTVVIGWEDQLGGSDELAESRLLNGDRHVRSQLAPIAEPGVLTITTTVDDFEVSMPAPSLGNKAVSLAARLFVNGEPAGERRIPVVFDEHPPSFAAALPRRSIPIESTRLAASINVRDLSGAALVEAWMTPERFKAPEELDPKTAVRIPRPEAGPFQADADQIRRLDLSLPLPPKVEPGSYFLTLRVTDRSGQSAHNLGAELPFEINPKPAPVDPGPLVGDVRGQVMVGSKPAQKAGLNVFIKEQPQLKGVTDGAGRFIIKNVEEGEYTLVVEGTVTGVPTKGEHPIKLKAKKDYQGVVVVATLHRSPPKDAPP